MSTPRIKEPADFRVLIVYPNLPLMLIPSLAVALFTSIFKRKGYQAQLFETTYYMSDEATNTKARVERLQARRFDVVKELQIVIKNDMLGDFRRKVEEFRPDLVVMSTVEDTFLQGVRMLKAIEDLNVPHIVGGVFPTHAKGRCFDFPEIRMIGLGEGETIVETVAEAVRLNRPLHDIPGTWYRDDTGKIHRNANPPLVDINAVRPDFSLFDPKRFYRPMGGRMFKMIPLESYRGCPYTCTYCISPVMNTFAREAGQGKFLRRKTMDVLREEMRFYRDEYQPEFYYIVDDSFLARPKQEIFDFCDMYEEFKLPFYFNTRAENCVPDVMKRLKSVGCYRLEASAECGNDDYRKNVLLRNITNDKLLQHFNDITASGIAYSVDVMVGLPGETREMVMETVEFMRHVGGYDAVTTSVFTPYHGTVLRDVAIRNGWLDPKTICSGATTQSLLTMPEPYLNKDEIVQLASVLSLYCHFPKTEWDSIRRAETPDEEGMRLRNHYADAYNREFFGETQDARLARLHTGGTGCRANELNSFRIVTTPIPANELERLTLPAE